MKIAVLSGKGGTGKTLLSVNLAAAAIKAIYVDCDVEEPNGHLFFKPEIREEEIVTVKIPLIDKDLCDGCRKCVDFCKFNALAYINDNVLIFDDICHSCGACSLICPKKAISEVDKQIGVIKKGISEQVYVNTGILNTGEASAIPIIKKLLNNAQDIPDITLIDCPPGSACSVMESIKSADFCIIVAEPTIFGTDNLKMVYELVQLFNKPFGVVLNKCIEDDNPSEIFCIQNNINIIGKIPYDTILGKLNSDAEIAVRVNQKYRQLFTSLLEIVKKEVNYATTFDTKR